MNALHSRFVANAVLSRKLAGVAVLLAGVDILVVSMTAPVAAEPVAPEPVDFTLDVRPILADRCFPCHGPDSATREAGLRLDQQAAAFEDLGGYAAIAPGDADASEIVTRIEEPDDAWRMPPESSGKRLTPDEIETLRRWIDQGATYRRHWAFDPPARPSVPSPPSPATPSSNRRSVTDAGDSDRAANPIDRFVLARMQREGLDPSPPADRETWLRRVTLDLTGLPPTIPEIDAFLADTDPAAERRVVDRLMHSERYGEAMALEWMDAARYADTDGYQNDGPREMWAWRDWVIDAFNSGMPFDQFTIEQLAGDLLPDATLSQRIATGFNRNHRYNSEAGLVLDEFLLENAVDRVDTTSTVWMGLTIGCARCHDHKFDPVSQREYYQLISFFDNVAESGRAVKFGNSEPWIKAPTRSQAAELAEHDRRVEEFRSRLRRQRPRIDEALRKWLKNNQVDPATHPSVTHQAQHRFSFDAEDPETANGKDHKGSRDKTPGGNAGPVANDARIPGLLDEGLVEDGVLGARRRCARRRCARRRCRLRRIVQALARKGRRRALRETVLDRLLGPPRRRFRWGHSVAPSGQHAATGTGGRTVRRQAAILHHHPMGCRRRRDRVDRVTRARAMDTCDTHERRLPKHHRDADLLRRTPRRDDDAP